MKPEQLTNQPQTLYPGVRGNLFMAEDKGEVPKGGAPTPPEIPKTPRPLQEPVLGREAPPEEVEAARRAWQKATRKQELDLNEEWLAKRGIFPMTGAQEHINLTGVTDPRLLAFGENINARGLVAISDFDLLREDYRALERMNGDIPEGQKVSLRRELERLMGEAAERPTREAKRRPVTEIRAEGEEIADPETATIVSELSNAIERAQGSEDVATLQEYVERLSARRQELHTQTIEEIRRVREEADRRFDAHENIKQIVEDRERAWLAAGAREKQAEEFLDRLYERAARRFREAQRLPEQMRLATEIVMIKDPIERRRRLKEAIYELAPDLNPIDQSILRLIAEDRETSEFFVDRIISKPYREPDQPYSLGFYAEINLRSFFDEIESFDTRNPAVPVEQKRQRVLQYANQRETAMRFHEMNRIINVESGNIDAYINMTRLVSPRHIDVALKEDGVEEVRQLIDQEFAALYSRDRRVTDKNLRELYEEVEKQFRVWNETDQVQSKHGRRPLEEWELRRALALGRNISNAFFRNAGLITMGHIPEHWQRWIESFPQETIARGFAGFKYLILRFHIGTRRLGDLLANLVLGKLQKGYKEKKADEKMPLGKIGQLSIEEDIIPAGYLNPGGFDKGWRTIVGYLDGPGMRLTDQTMDLNVTKEDYPELGGQIIKEERDATGKITLRIRRVPVETVGEALIFAEREGEKVGLIERRPWRNYTLEYMDEGKQKAIVREYLEPLIGEVTRDGQITGKINLCLGVLLDRSVIETGLKEKLWQKAAHYLPLRIAYYFPDEVKNLLNQEQYKEINWGEFKKKLLLIQRHRIRLQRDNPEVPVPLDSFWYPEGRPEFALSEQEKNLVRGLQRLGWENAKRLANVPFSDVPFLDDVPFGKTNTDAYGAEVFPRRMGGDFSSWFRTNGEFIALVNNPGMPYEEVLKHLDAIILQLATPENITFGQGKTLPILKSYLELAQQWVWTRWIPFAKTIRNFVGLPTSLMQFAFGPNKTSESESGLNQMARIALEQGIIRREQLPGEDKSQMNDLLEFIGAKWYNVLIDQARTLSIIILLFMLAKFTERVVKEKT